ncbi:MAG TPA: glycosyltransferase family 4 protein [Planctomycetota bacterium]|nr:glycosyltransferase family 4 protein [Planctomycetota bacterium]
MSEPAARGPGAPAKAALRPVMVVPDFDRIGGYELQALSLAAHHERTGVRSFVLSNNPWGHAAREERLGVTIHRLPPLPPERPNWAALFVSFLTFLNNHRREYDVIHCHALTFLAACCARIARILKKPVVVKVATERDVREYHDNRTLAFRLFFRWLKRADRLLCLSESIRREAIACGFRPEQAVIVPNGVDTERFAPAAEPARAAARTTLQVAGDTPGAPFVALFVGRLVQRKGVDVLLRAWAATRDARQGLLLVVGDGPERASLERLARDLGLEFETRVRFLGERTDVRPCYAAADAFVFPSRLEGLPNALLEAMSCGLPSIATRIGGCLDVMTEQSGMLVPSDDVGSLAGAIDELAGDPARRTQLAVAARRRVLAHFSFAVTAARLQQVYREAAAGKAGVAG